MGFQAADVYTTLGSDVETRLCIGRGDLNLAALSADSLAVPVW